MKDENKLAKEWYQIVYRDLANLMNQHYQISQAAPFHGSLPALAAHIRRVAACCEVWKAVAYYNAKQKDYQGG